MVEKTLKLENISIADIKTATAAMDALARYSEETSQFVNNMDRIRMEAGTRKVAGSMAGERNPLLVRFGNLALSALDKHNDEAALLAVRTGMNAASLRDVGAARAIDAAGEALSRMVSGSAGPQDRMAIFS